MGKSRFELVWSRGQVHDKLKPRYWDPTEIIPLRKSRKYESLIRNYEHKTLHRKKNINWQNVFFPLPNPLRGIEISTDV